MLIDEIKCPAKIVVPDAHIEHGIGCSREEILKLVLRFQREFRVDMSGFDVDKHFSGRGVPLWLIAPILLVLVVGVPVVLLAPDGWRDSYFYGFSVLAVLALIATIAWRPSARNGVLPEDPLTVEHLIRAAKLGRWLESEKLSARSNGVQQ